MSVSHQHIPTMEDRNTNFSTTVILSTITSSKHASPTITSVTERLPSIHTPSVPSSGSSMPGLDTFLMLRAVSNRRNGKIIERESQTVNPILMDNTESMDLRFRVSSRF